MLYLYHLYVLSSIYHMFISVHSLPSHDPIDLHIVGGAPPSFTEEGSALH